MASVVGNSELVEIDSVVVVGHCTALSRDNRFVTLYNCQIKTLHHTWTVRKLFSDFCQLRDCLVDRYLIPIVPKKPTMMMMNGGGGGGGGGTGAIGGGATGAGGGATGAGGANGKDGLSSANAALSAVKNIQSFASEMTGVLSTWMSQLLYTEDIARSPEVVKFCTTSASSSSSSSSSSNTALPIGSGSSGSDGGDGSSGDAASTSSSSSSSSSSSTIPLAIINPSPFAQYTPAASSSSSSSSSTVTTATDTSSCGSSSGGVGKPAASAPKAIPSSGKSDSSGSGATIVNGEQHRQQQKQRSRGGTSLRDFTLLKVIGKGSFGKVMLVRKTDTNKIYAMKVLSKESVIQRNQVEHTKTERNVLEYIHHPFIVQMHYAFQTHKKLYFILDYCPGGEVFFHLGRAGRFSEHRVRFYAAEIILAMEYLHDLGIVYRDLKPENVLLDGQGHIAITDFGLSKEGIADNVSAHSFCGTPEYLAPEILTRTGHGRAADWWSLGALLYEMLTGMPPFYSRNRERLFHRILKSELKLPRFFSEHAKTLLLGLLDRNHQTRLGSVRDAAELKEHKFFESVDWELILMKELTPPFQPQVSDNYDTGNFDQEFTKLPVDDDSLRCMLDDDQQQQHSGPGSSGGDSGSIGKLSSSSGRFAGFTYIPEKDHPLTIMPIYDDEKKDLTTMPSGVAAALAAATSAAEADAAAAITTETRR